MIGKILAKSSAKGTVKGGKKAGRRAIDGVAERKSTFATRSYAPEDIAALAGEDVAGEGTPEKAPPETASRVAGPEVAGARPGARSGAVRTGEKRAGLRYQKDGRIGPKKKKEAAGSVLEDEELEDLFDPTGNDLLPKVILWVIGILAVVGLLVALVVSFAIAREIFGGGEGDAGDAEAARPAGLAAYSQEERAAAAVAEGFTEAYLTLSAGENYSATEERISQFAASAELGSLIGLRSGGGVDREVLSVSSYRVESVADGRYVVFTDALARTEAPGAESSSDASSLGKGSGDGGSSDESSSEENSRGDDTTSNSTTEVDAAEGFADGTSSAAADDATGSGTTGGSASSAAAVNSGEPVLRRMALKVYVAGGDGRYAVVAPPEAVSVSRPSEADGSLAGSGALGTANRDSYQLTDDALEAHLRGYFSAAYGDDDAQSSVKQFFAGNPGARIPDLPDDDFTYVDYEGATLYEVPEDRVPEGFGEAYEAEAYVSVREEATGATANHTHLLEVAKTEGGEWTILRTIGG